LVVDSFVDLYFVVPLKLDHLKFDLNLDKVIDLFVFDLEAGSFVVDKVVAPFVVDMVVDNVVVP
jgi:hypothetical protein